MTALQTTKNLPMQPPQVFGLGNYNSGRGSNLRCHTQAGMFVHPTLATTPNSSEGHQATDCLTTMAKPLAAARIAGPASSWVTSVGIAPSSAEAVVANHTGLSNHKPLLELVYGWTEHEFPDWLESDEISACDSNVHGRLLYRIAFWGNIGASDFVLCIIRYGYFCVLSSRPAPPQFRA